MQMLTQKLMLTNLHSLLATKVAVFLETPILLLLYLWSPTLLQESPM